MLGKHNKPIQPLLPQIYNILMALIFLTTAGTGNHTFPTCEFVLTNAGGVRLLILSQIIHL